MNGISWLNYNHEFFARFCNALLSLEVSKHFIPYAASGRDGGIDGSYEGEYNNQSGKWRFQFKFHSTARKKAVSTLRFEIIDELSKLKDENHFILLTNVELLPQERESILEVAYERLVSLQKSNVKLDIWDGAKIYNFYLLHPMLRLWVEEGFTTAQLVDYKDYFKERLESDINYAATLSNDFTAREDELEDLHKFLLSDQLMALVSGEAGIGKTRLVVEFFKRYLDNDNKWQALVLNTFTINFDRLAHALTGSAAKMILIDDAHKHPAENISTLRNLVRQHPTKVKIILTARKALIQETVRHLSENERSEIVLVNLEKLAPEETQKFFQQQDIGYYKNYIQELTVISNGRPILMIELLRAIHKGIKIPKIKQVDFLRSYVRGYFDSVIKNTSNFTQVSQLTLWKLLRTICLIEPIVPSNILPAISEQEKVPIETIQYFLAQILNEGLAVGRVEYQISPDYYSDIILMEADPSFIMNVMATFPDKLHNIIPNLAAVEESFNEGESTYGFDEILSKYLSGIEEGSYLEVQGIVSTIAGIAYTKQKIAAQCVDKLEERISGDDLFRDRVLGSIKSRTSSNSSLFTWCEIRIAYFFRRFEFKQKITDQQECVPGRISAV